MAEISRVALFGKLNSLCYKAIESMMHALHALARSC